MNTVKKIAVAVSLLFGLWAGSAQAAPVSVPFVDAGVYNVVTLLSSGTTLQSAHFTSLNGNGTHQFHLTGGDSNAAFSNNRNSYTAFDLSGVTAPVTSATLRLWSWSENGLEVISGMLRSPTSENLQFRGLNSHTAADVINAPFGDTTNHVVDVPIFNDLGTGTFYGERLITQADEEGPGLIASPHPFATSTDADCADGAQPGEQCGRWIDYDLPGALADINATSGTFLIGASLEDISGGGTQQVLSGNVYDLLFASGADNNPFQTAQPQLILETVPIPAAVWLFGSGLIGLVGISRRRRSDA